MKTLNKLISVLIIFAFISTVFSRQITQITIDFFPHLFTEPEFKKIKIGQQYQFSYDEPSEDPFKKMKIDTVTVLDKKNGYVLVRFNQGINQSMKIEIFVSCTKNFNPNHQ